MSQTSNDVAFFVYLNKINMTCNYYSFMVVINLGLAGNVVNMLIFIIRRKYFAKSTMGFYNLFMSVFNILSLITAYVYIFPVSVGQVNLGLVSDLGCALIPFYTRLLSDVFLAKCDGHF